MRKNNMRVFFKVSVVMLLAALPACNLLKPVKPLPISTFVLNKMPRTLPVSRSHPVTLLVSQSTTKPVYNTTRMMYSKRPHQVSAYGLNEWAKTPSEMLHPLIVQTLNKTNYFHAVVTSANAGSYQYSLSTQIFQLQQDFTRKTPVVKLSLHAQLMKAGSNRVIAAKVFNVTQRMSQRSPYAGVMAANKATERLLRQLVSFTLSAMRKAK